ncbi:MAG: amino acid carrier protein [Planctomycetes bacterium]|nr:amino acid carrier protein [Planctomycetota bacterium]
MHAIIEFCADIGGFLWGRWTFFILMGAGILFTLWTKMTQYMSLTHGFAVVRGVYDDPDDPGAINHFQALSAALSATVGLGNIGGVALAIAAGGPGSLFWMWVIGFFGMALKSVEITLAMMYRDTSDPDNPHGGTMWVVERVLGDKGGIWKTLARIIGVFFCITLIISTITGGNMFQSWSVADLTHTFWDVPKIVSAIILVVVVGLVIIGGIKRIGSVAARLVPIMCVLYLISGLAVLAVNIADIPAMLLLIVTSAFKSTDAAGAFLGGSLAWAFSTGLRRALFSNEAGQGSAPIAHAAAKTDQPAREGIIGGMGPFIDTICICTLTALVILLTGTWNRGPLLQFERAPVVAPAFAFDESPITITGEASAGDHVWMTVTPPREANPAAPSSSERLTGELVDSDGALVVRWNAYTAFTAPSVGTMELRGKSQTRRDPALGKIETMPRGRRWVHDGGTPDDDSDDLPMWGVLSGAERIEFTDDQAYLWEKIGDVFTIVEGDDTEDTEGRLHKLKGKATLRDGTLAATWGTIGSAVKPTVPADSGLYRDYKGASLTAHAFDRQFPGLGKILVTMAAWLFAISTMISWSYYGEQGVIYMLGQRLVLPYKFVYLALAIVGAVAITETDDMEALMDLGTGAMLWSNIPIVVVLGFLAVRSLSKYGIDLKAGKFPRHGAPLIEDVASGEDVERD